MTAALAAAVARAGYPVHHLPSGAGQMRSRRQVLPGFTLPQWQVPLQVGLDDL